MTSNTKKPRKVNYKDFDIEKFNITPLEEGSKEKILFHYGLLTYTYSENNEGPLDLEGPLTLSRRGIIKDNSFKDNSGNEIIKYYMLATYNQKENVTYNNGLREYVFLAEDNKKYLEVLKQIQDKITAYLASDETKEASLMHSKSGKDGKLKISKLKDFSEDNLPDKYAIVYNPHSESEEDSGVRLLSHKLFKRLDKDGREYASKFYSPSNKPVNWKFLEGKEVVYVPITNFWRVFIGQVVSIKRQLKEAITASTKIRTFGSAQGETLELFKDRTDEFEKQLLEMENEMEDEKPELEEKQKEEKPTMPPGKLNIPKTQLQNIMDGDDN